MSEATPDRDVVMAALQAATAKSQHSPLSEAEFRDIYQAALRDVQQRRKRMEEAGTVQHRGEPVVAPQQPIQLRRGGIRQHLPLQRLPFILWEVVKLLALSFMFSTVHNFRYVFIFLLCVRVAVFFSSKLSLRIDSKTIERRTHPEDEFFSDQDDEARAVRMSGGRIELSAEALQQMQRRRAVFDQNKARKRRWLVLRMAMKCLSTFFLSIVPSWRVDNLRAELIAEGLHRNEALRRPEPPSNSEGGPT